ncbi:hypothetical protein PR048_003151 [Dryococelus australis]|uniref:Uncharacterized protein n=1 Tax=Dryococelus australis TaxID=614101 RepID=A0ABQ9IN77_9NEOP|nr:hypothetical protein PR048_003151 [Dryococelus australis]
MDKLDADLPWRSWLVRQPIWGAGGSGFEPRPTWVIEASIEQRLNEGAGETIDPREDSPINGIVRHDSHMRKSGVTRPGIEPGSPMWEASSLTTIPPRPPSTLNHANKNTLIAAAILGFFGSRTQPFQRYDFASLKRTLAARSRSRSEGAIRATLKRTLSASSLLRARHAVFPSKCCTLQIRPVVWCLELGGRAGVGECESCRVVARTAGGCSGRVRRVKGWRKRPGHLLAGTSLSCCTSSLFPRQCGVSASSRGGGREGEKKKKTRESLRKSWGGVLLYPEWHFLGELECEASREIVAWGTALLPLGRLPVFQQFSCTFICHYHDSQTSIAETMIRRTCMAIKEGSGNHRRKLTKPRFPLAKTRLTPPGIESGLPWWDASSLDNNTSECFRHRSRKSAAFVLENCTTMFERITVPLPTGAMLCIGLLGGGSAGRGNLLRRLLASHQDEPGSIPGGVTSGFSCLGIMTDDAAGRRVFSGISRFPRDYIPALLHTRLTPLDIDLCGRHALQAGVKPVDKEMARGTELSDFDKGVIVSCHLSGLSSRTIAWKVNRPKSTVAFVLRKWKVRRVLCQCCTFWATSNLDRQKSQNPQT